MCIFMQHDRGAELVTSLGSLTIHRVTKERQQTRFLTCHLNWQLEDSLRVILLSLAEFYKTGALQDKRQPSQLPSEFETGCQRRG